MKPAEAAKAVAYLAKLFPGQMTDELVRHAHDRFVGYDERPARKAIAEHRDAHEFISWPQLWEGCRAASQAENPDGKPSREQSWFDVYRRQRPQLREAGDAEVALRVHRDWWIRCGRSDSSRRQFEASCVNQLVNAGMTGDAAREWTASIFNESVSYFRDCLEELRRSTAGAQRLLAAETCPL